MVSLISCSDSYCSISSHSVCVLVYHTEQQFLASVESYTTYQKFFFMSCSIMSSQQWFIYIYISWLIQYPAESLMKLYVGLNEQLVQHLMRI